MANREWWETNRCCMSWSVNGQYLNDNQQFVLAQRDNGYTRKDIALELHVSETRIRQIEQKARQLRKSHSSQYLFILVKEGEHSCYLSVPHRKPHECTCGTVQESGAVNV